VLLCSNTDTKPANYLADIISASESPLVSGFRTEKHPNFSGIYFQNHLAFNEL
jgi:hypothetical protein